MNMKMNLKRNLLVMAAVVLMAMGANAQLLWKVTSPKSDKVSYILGTHHFAPVNFLDSIPGFAQALDNAAKVYGEIDMELMMKPETLMAMQKMMMAPADSTLDKVLTAGQMENLNRVWAKYGPEQMPAQMLPMLKPAAVSSQLAAGMAMQVLPPMDLTQGIDQTVQVRAKQAGKPVAGLETVEFQTNMLMGAPIAEQAKDLMETVDDIEAEGDKVVKLTNAYLRQDLSALEALILEAQQKDPAGQEKLITGRNRTWAGILKEEMQTTPLLVVVGAGHLPAREGLLQLLRDAGYTVTPVK